MSVEREQLEAIALRLRKLKLEAPAIFLLEAYKPLIGVADAMAAMAHPVAALLGLADKSEKVRRFLESRDNVEELIRCLEAK